VRVDAGVEEGDDVGGDYDPMIAKLVAYGDDREQALDRLTDALAETEVRGVTTNLPFLRWLVSHPVFRAGDVATDFLTRFPPLSAYPARLPAGPWEGGWRLNLPTAPSRRAPQVEEAARRGGAAGADGRVTAPMPGKVIDVKVEPGTRVESHQPLVVLEAMKMEQVVTAPYAAGIRSVDVAVGEQVGTGTVLVTLEAA
jgi:acetyl/propionyl-CoA carboxylase alpha subunit